MIDDITADAFLDGRLTVSQPRKGYRAGVDPVLLAAAVDAKAGQKVLELGCGVGVASLCLAQRVNGLSVTGIELQAAYAELARHNATENNLDLKVFNADLRDLPAQLRQRRYDHVMMNPPYFDRKAGTAADDHGRDIALGGDTPLADWIAIGARRVGPRGYMTIIQRMERLLDVLHAVQGRLGSIIVCPISGREDRAPELFLLQARQEGRAAFRMTTPLIMHIGIKHQGDMESYTPQVRDVLRNGAKLSIWH